jgi:hypothetical protein
VKKQEYSKYRTDARAGQCGVVVSKTMIFRRRIEMQLIIEWRHYDKDGLTCSRCSGTGANLAAVVAEYQQKGINIELQETLLPFDRISESNLVLINGVALEELLAGGSAGESECVSCGCLAGQATSCRTVQLAGVVYDELSPELIRLGIDAVLCKNKP